MIFLNCTAFAIVNLFFFYRTIGLNQNVKSGHTLLRCMMNNMWKPTMGNAVLTLYLSHVVQFSEDSLLTLYALQERTAFASSIHDIVVSSTFSNECPIGITDGQQRIVFL